MLQLRCRKLAAATQPRGDAMSLAKEFKEFAMKGNVIDMAVGVIIGAAFGKIIASIVDDIIMPPIGQVDRRRALLRSRGQPRHERGRQDRGAV